VAIQYSNNTNYENYLHSLSEPQLQQIITLSDNDAPTITGANNCGNGRGSKCGTKDQQQLQQQQESHQSLLTPPQQQLANIERENRLSAILILHSRGLNQEQIAQELHIDQSTVSRDLRLVQQESKNRVERYLREDILLEYLRYLVGSNEITQTLWDIVQNQATTKKEKLSAISLLMQMYGNRLQRMSGAPEAFLNAKKSVSEADFRKALNSNPMLQHRVNLKDVFGKDPFSVLSK
jgi:predicted transcriptional regulator